MPQEQIFFAKNSHVFVWLILEQSNRLSGLYYKGLPVDHFLRGIL